MYLFIITEDFETVIKRTSLCTYMDLNSPFMRLYFGNDKSRKINYAEFTQFLHDFHEECGIEAFRKFDKQGTGEWVLYARLSTPERFELDVLLSPGVFKVVGLKQWG